MCRRYEAFPRKSWITNKSCSLFIHFQSINSWTFPTIHEKINEKFTFFIIFLFFFQLQTVRAVFQWKYNRFPCNQKKKFFFEKQYTSKTQIFPTLMELNGLIQQCGFIRTRTKTQRKKGKPFIQVFISGTIGD